MIKNHIVYNPILEYKFTLQKAVGSLLWTKEGKRLIDFTSGWNIANLGWNHPEITAAITDQLAKNTYTPSWIADEMQISYADSLTKALPHELNAICRVTSGTEANEQAIKIARTVTGRQKILGFFDTYHGSTYASLSLGYRPEYLQNLSPVVGEMIHLEYPKLSLGCDVESVRVKFLSALEEVLSHQDVAAILTEAGIITGWGSLSVSPPEFLSDIRRLTTKYGTLLILDEVGTGFSRTGSLFAFEQTGVTPDILTLAKAMSNGVAAIGACITSADLIEGHVPAAKVLSSLAWMPLGCAAAAKALEIHLRDKVGETTKQAGSYLTKRLRNLTKMTPAYIRGQGLEIGIDFLKYSDDKESFNYVSAIAKACFDRGLLVNQSDAATLQLMPPLNTSQPLFVEACDILAEAVEFTDKTH
ncbi:MAG: aspartate aminotransferase family protein [Microgenomates group bacterium]